MEQWNILPQRLLPWFYVNRREQVDKRCCGTYVFQKDIVVFKNLSRKAMEKYG